MKSLILLISFLELLQTVWANPIVVPINMPCRPAEYKVESTKPVQKGPVLVSGREVKGCASECSLSKEDSLSIGVEVSVGVDLGIDYEAASAGVGLSVSFSQTRAEAWTETAGCPDEAYCKLTVTYDMVRVSGRKIDNSIASPQCTPKSGPYTIQLPQTVPTPSGPSAKVSYAACFGQGTKFKAYPGFDYQLCPDYPMRYVFQPIFEAIQRAGPK